MRITIRLLASYRRYLPAHSDERAGYALEVADGALVAHVLKTLPVPQDDVFTLLVNGRHVADNQVLQEGDVLSVFPAVGGG